MADSYCTAEILESFLSRLNGVIRQNNFFLNQGTPQALELYQLEKEDFLIWFSNELNKAKAIGNVSTVSNIIIESMQ